MPGLHHGARSIAHAATEASMNKRQTTILGSTWAGSTWTGLSKVVGKLVLRSIPAASAGRPAGSPVVFRHYL